MKHGDIFPLGLHLDLFYTRGCMRLPAPIHRGCGGCRRVLASILQHVSSGIPFLISLPAPPPSLPLVLRCPSRAMIVGILCHVCTGCRLHNNPNNIVFGVFSAFICVCVSSLLSHLLFANTPSYFACVASCFHPTTSSSRFSP